VSGSDVRITTMKQHCVTGYAPHIREIQSVSFSLGGREYTHALLVCLLPTETAVLLENAGAKSDLESGQMALTDIGRVPRAFGVPHAKHTALTVYAEGKAGRSSQLSQQETRRIEEQLSAGLRPETVTHESRTWLVRAKQNIVVVPSCRQIVVGTLESEKEQSLPALVCVEPAQIPIERNLPERALSRVE
jgi:hypothetical protein